MKVCFLFDTISNNKHSKMFFMLFIIIYNIKVTIIFIIVFNIVNNMYNLVILIIFGIINNKSFIRKIEIRIYMYIISVSYDLEQILILPL